MSSNYTMRLKPLSDESLPIIEVIDSGVPICLGRNLTTQIKSKGMSRKLCDIEVTCAGEMFLMMRKNPDEHFLQINGMKVFELPGVRIPILKGSIVSLDKMYRYEVDLDKSNTETGLNNVVSNNIDGGSESILNQELICSICLEIIVESTVINPCGHVYCFSCIEHYRRRYDDCPNCRCSIQSLIRVQYTDNIIYNLIKKGEFNEDDTMHYLKRNGKNLSQDEIETINSNLKKAGNSYHGDKRKLEGTKAPHKLKKNRNRLPMVTRSFVRDITGKCVENAICID